MSVLAIIAASSLVAADWKSPPAVGPDDYPSSALLRDKSAATILDILVDPDGKVIDCIVVASYGDQHLASQICGIVKRKQAKAAIDGAGHYAFGFKREFAKLYLPGTYQGDEVAELSPGPDVELEVASLPVANAQALQLDLTLAINRGGKVTECDYDQSAAAKAYAAAACAQARTMEFDRLTAPDGTPIDYVRALSVRFNLAG